jgi:predicted DNA-binding transcriptional regulator AlpA
MKRSYATDLSDTEWECLEPHVPPPSKRGRPTVHATRQILNAILLPVGKVLRLPLYSPSTSQVIDWLTLIGAVGVSRATLYRYLKPDETPRGCPIGQMRAGMNTAEHREG